MLCFHSDCIITTVNKCGDTSAGCLLFQGSTYVWFELSHTLRFLWGVSSPQAISSGSNLEKECPAATVIICSLTQVWVRCVRSHRPKSIGAIFMAFKEFVLRFLNFSWLFWAFAGSQRCIQVRWLKLF